MRNFTCNICKTYKECKKICHNLTYGKYCKKPLSKHKKCPFCTILWHNDNPCSCTEEKTRKKIKSFCHICGNEILDYENDPLNRFLTRGNCCTKCSIAASIAIKSESENSKNYKDYAQKAGYNKTIETLLEKEI